MKVFIKQIWIPIDICDQEYTVSRIAFLDSKGEGVHVRDDDRTESAYLLKANGFELHGGFIGEVRHTKSLSPEGVLKHFIDERVDQENFFEEIQAIFDQMKMD